MEQSPLVCPDRGCKQAALEEVMSTRKSGHGDLGTRTANIEMPVYFMVEPRAIRQPHASTRRETRFVFFGSAGATCDCPLQQSRVTA